MPTLRGGRGVRELVRVFASPPFVLGLVTRSTRSRGRTPRSTDLSLAEHHFETIQRRQGPTAGTMLLQLGPHVAPNPLGSTRSAMFSNTTLSLQVMPSPAPLFFLHAPRPSSPHAPSFTFALPLSPGYDGLASALQIRRAQPGDAPALGPVQQDPPHHHAGVAVRQSRCARSLTSPHSSHHLTLH